MGHFHWGHHHVQEYATSNIWKSPGLIDHTLLQSTRNSLTVPHKLAIDVDAPGLPLLMLGL